MKTSDMAEEKWRPVTGFEGLYEVSSLGNVRSCTRRVRTKRNGRWCDRAIKGKPMKANLSSVGYPMVQLSRAGETVARNVHTLVLTAFVGPRLEGMECRHLNGVRADSRLENLAWGTKSENMADKALHGTHQGGERNGFAKLTEEQVIAIRNAPKGTVTRLCRELGIARSNAIKIRARHGWAHISEAA